MTTTTTAPGRVLLDSDTISCDACGVPGPAGPSYSMATETIVTATDPHGRPLNGARVGRCPSCAALHVTARQLDPFDPLPLVRALACYRIVGLSLPSRATSPELRRWLGRFDPLWSSRLWEGTEQPGTAPSAPWGHVDDRGRALILTQLTRWAHVRARPGVPVRVPAPAGGCLMCGLDAIEIPADRAHAIPESLWRPASVYPAALGGKGARRLNGAICGDCETAAMDDGLGVRVFGPSALETALVAWWESHGHADTARLVRSGVFGPPIGWGVSGLPPNRVPWAHIEPPSIA